MASLSLPGFKRAWPAESSKAFSDRSCHLTPQKYKINSATIAMFFENDHHVSVKIPTGSVVIVDSEIFNGDKLVEVIWAEKKVMMFTQDIRTRGEKV